MRGFWGDSRLHFPAKPGSRLRQANRQPSAQTMIFIFKVLYKLTNPYFPSERRKKEKKKSLNITIMMEQRYK